MNTTYQHLICAAGITAALPLCFANPVYANSTALDTISAVQNENTTAIHNRDELRNQAVAAARAGDYNSALPILKKLYNENKSDIPVLSDYLTVLNWAGNYTEAITVYEGQKSSILPAYAQLNAAASYYRMGQYDEAALILKPLVAQGSTQAQMQLAQVYMKQKRIEEADAIYDKLHEQNPHDITVYENKADAAVSVQNWSMAASIWSDTMALCDEELSKLTPDTPAYKEKYLKKVKLADNLSASYIRLGRFQQAEDTMMPYIKNETATVNMLGNYIVLLNQTKHFKQVPAVFDKYFRNEDGSVKKNTPLFIVRELADSYVRAKNYDEAARIYSELIISAPAGAADIEDRFKLAYYGCYTKKFFNEAIRQYSIILKTKDKNSANFSLRVLNDAHEFLRKGQLKTAQAIYYQLIAHDKRFANIYAGDLITEEQYQSALHEYHKMIKDSDIADAGWEGVAKTSEKLRDYKTLEQTEQLLSAKHNSNESEYQKAAGSRLNRQQGEVYLDVISASDHDDTDQTDVNLHASQYIGNSMFIETELGRSYIKDNDDGNTAVLNTSRAGVRYTRRKWDTLAALSLFNTDGSHAGLYFNTLFRPDDTNNLNFIFSNEPVYDSDVLESEDGPVFADDYLLRYTYNVNQLESYYIQLGHTDYDDGNKRYSWEAGQNLLIYNDEKKGKTLERTLHWGRERHSNQEVDYNSPKLSESIGGEWRWGKDLAHYDTIYHILGVNWERDYPDELTLNPYARIEYEKNVDAYHNYTIGAMYGWRTANWLGNGPLRYNNKQIDFTYHILW